MDKKLLKGAATTLILSLLDERPMHGYELTQSIKERTQGIFQFSEGTIYPILYGLEDKRQIRGVWEVSDSTRRKKIYRLTSLGKKTLKIRLEQWSSFKKGLELVIGESS
ncbi:MAG: PadR family transcriptional regulator [Acidobacteriota bacterium]